MRLVDSVLLDEVDDIPCSLGRIRSTLPGILHDWMGIPSWLLGILRVPWVSPI